MKYNRENPLRVFTAFSGYDSQCLALERLQEEAHGFRYMLVGWSEIDKNAIKAHNILFPDAADKNYGDISAIDWREAPDFDLFTYSYPCQDISNAGRQKGLAEGSGTRSSLLWECLRAIEAKRPSFLLMENVKALVGKKFMPDFRRWCGRLEEMGYANFYQIMNAKHYGVPQNRERVFMVSILRTDADPEPHFSFPQPFPLERRLKHVLLPYGTVPESYYLSDEKVAKILAHCDRKVAEGCGFKPNFQTKDGVAGTIMARYGGRETDTYIKEPAEDAADSPILLGNVYASDTHGGRGGDVYRADGICRCLAASAGGASQTYVAVAEPISCAIRGRNPDNPSDRASGIPTEQRLEMGDDIANCITTVQKDSLVAEPISHVIASEQKHAYVGSTDSVSPCLTQMMGSGGGNVPMITEPAMLQPNCFSGERKYTESDVTQCLTSARQRQMYIKEPTIMPVGNIYPSGGQGGKVVSPDGIAPTVCECHGEVTRITEPVQCCYRIRKLTPKECFRLMDVDDPDIDKLIEAKDAKGKPELSKSACYKLAGNSIVVGCLWHIFREMFINH